MNSQGDTSTSASTASPGLKADLFRANFNTEVLSTISLQDLRQLDDAIRTLADVCSALLCQPRFWLDNRVTPAGWQMDCILQLLSCASDHIVDTAKARVSDDVREVEIRGRMMMEDSLRAEEALEELVCRAANEARTLQKARFHARTGSPTG